MLKFTICFIKQEDRILLLNREKPSWMGCWNALGGKIEPNENPRSSALREVNEESGIILDDIHFKGIVTWIVDGKWVGGMYVYFAELPSHFHYEVPVKTDEGILDWKKVDWILHSKNQGIANNIPRSIVRIISESDLFEHRCFYSNDQMIRDEFIKINEGIEHIREDEEIKDMIFSK